MKVYIAFCSYRHIEPVITVHKSLETAVEACKAFVREKARSPEKIKEEHIPGWLYYATYSSEEDHAHVEETELKE